MVDRDWTMGKDGRTNSSAKFQAMCDAVESLIRGEGFTLINGGAKSTARLIVAQLAHKHKLAPQPSKKAG